MKNYRQGFVSPLIILIIAVAAIAGGTYLYKQKTTKPDTASSAVENNAEAKNNLENLGDQKDRSNLKHYSTPIGGFELYYPSDFCVSESKQSGALSLTVANTSDCLKINVTSKTLRAYISVGKARVSNVSALEKAINQQESSSDLDGEISEIKHTKLGGYDALTFHVKQTSPTSSEKDHYEIVTIREGLQYSISYPSNNPDFLQKIIDGFTFIPITEKLPSSAPTIQVR
jgi:hypothetical protein